MAKYRITLQPKNIWDNEITKDYIGVNRENAEAIALIYNKGASVVKAIRIGGDQSTEKDLNDMVELMNSAIREGNEEIYEQQKNAFEQTVKALQGKMNAVAWAKTKGLIPECPIM